MSNEKVTTRDHQQIHCYEHDEVLNAKRVVIVGGQMPEIRVSESSSPSSVTQIETIQVPVVVKEIQIERIEIPVIQTIKEIQVERIEVPVVVKEVQFERIEVPVYTTEVKVVTVEKPVIVSQIEYKELPVWLRVCLVAQILTSIIMLLKMCIK